MLTIFTAASDALMTCSPRGHELFEPGCIRARVKLAAMLDASAKDNIANTAIASVRIPECIKERILKVGAPSGKGRYRIERGTAVY